MTCSCAWSSSQTHLGIFTPNNHSTHVTYVASNNFHQTKHLFLWRFPQLKAHMQIFNLTVFLFPALGKNNQATQSCVLQAGSCLPWCQWDHGQPDRWPAIALLSHSEMQVMHIVEGGIKIWRNSFTGIDCICMCILYMHALKHGQKKTHMDLSAQTTLYQAYRTFLTTGLDCRDPAFTANSWRKNKWPMNFLGSPLAHLLSGGMAAMATATSHVICWCQATYWPTSCLSCVSALFNPRLRCSDACAMEVKEVVHILSPNIVE